MKTIVWLREDLRLRDNPALHYAASKGEVCLVYIYPEGLGGASYWWLHRSLESLSHELDQWGVRLVLRTGAAEAVLADICELTCADQLVWNRVYSPDGIEQGQRVKERLSDSHVELKSFNAQLLIEPTQVFNKQGTPFKVFTPFWRHCLSSKTLNQRI